MQFILTSEYSLTIESDLVSLRDLRPVLNGGALDDARAEIIANDATRIELQFTAPALGEATFGVELARENETRAWLRYWIAGLNDAPDSFGVGFQRVENLRAYLRNGYTSWDGSFYVEPEALRDFQEYEARPETGFAMTQLLPRDKTGSVVIGFDRHDRFQHTFTIRPEGFSKTLRVSIQTLWDRKPHAGRCESERLVLFEHSEIEDALREWAQIVARASRMLSGVEAPLRQSEPIIGWCSWYNLYGSANEANILEHLRGVEKIARQENLPMRVFQIDDGIAPEMGDWLDVKPQFPRGVKPLLDGATRRSHSGNFTASFVGTNGAKSITFSTRRIPTRSNICAACFERGDTSGFANISKPISCSGARSTDPIARAGTRKE
ncbi:MAG: hypothetical protein HZC40_01460 [Chloroflexi bacterium]|nr:hypothetical protein [Chloroflexota bacterium]